MTLEESNVIVLTLLSAQPYKKVTRSSPHVARLAASSSSFTSSSSSPFFATEVTRSETDIGTELRTKMRESTNSDVPFDFDQTQTQDIALQLQFAASLTSSSSAVSSSSSSSYPALNTEFTSSGISLLESGIETMSASLDPPFPPLVQQFLSGSLSDHPNQMIQTRSTTTADRDRNSDKTFFEPVPVQVLQVPKRSHRKKEPSDEQKGKKRSRDRSTQKKGEKTPPPSPPPVDLQKNHKSNISEFQSVSGSRNRTRTGSEKTILPSSSSFSSKTKMTVVRGEKEKEVQQEPQEPKDVFFLSDDSPPIEFFPIGHHPGSTSPLMPLHPQEGATPRGVSAALVLLTTKSSVMTTLASPQPTTRTLATSATTSSDTKISKKQKQKQKKEQQKLQPSSRSSPMGGSPIKMRYSSRDEEHEATETINEISSTSSSSSTLPSFLSDSITSTVGNTIASTIALAASAISSLTRQSHHLPLLFLHHNHNPHDTHQKGNEQEQEKQSQTKQDEDILLLFGIPVLPLTS